MAKQMKHETRKALTGWAFISPWVIGFAIFTLFPIVYSILMSLSDYTPATGHMLFNGFRNFKSLFQENRTIFITPIVTFLKDSLFMVFIINVFAVLFAVLLNTDVKGRGLFRTLFFLPVVIVSGPVMERLINDGIITMPNLGDLGVIRVIGSTFGTSIQELIVKSFSDLIEMFWYSGVQLIVYLSMIQKMDKSMYEAAEIDGASPWESFWKITLPALKPVILINIIYTFIFLASFEQTNPVIKAIDNLKEIGGTAGGMNAFGYGLAAAASWVYFFVLLIIVAVVALVFYLRKKPNYKFSFNRDRLGLPINRYEKKVTKFNSSPKVKKIRRFFMGRKVSDGFLAKLFTYVILVIVAFAFLYPILDMLLLSFQSPEDILNPMVGSLPSAMYIGNYQKAFEVIGFWNALKNSIYYSLVPTLCQVVAAAFIGYGLAKFQFKGKFVVFALVVMTFIIPTQLLSIPTYQLYSMIGFKGTIWTIALPALLGQGLKSAIFILIFFQSFSMIPKDLDEAAYIDGANSFQVFVKIAIPLSIPILIVGFIFSFVWYWNETYLLGMYVGAVKTLPRQLADFQKTYEALIKLLGPNADPLLLKPNEAIYTAGTLITILPLLILYFVLQRWFVEGIDRAGLTGQ